MTSSPLEPYNTRTPLIAWGEGVRGQLPDPTASTHDTYSEAWGLTHLIRRDVEQADISAIISALLGINWPVSSIGILPDVSPSKSGYLLPKEGNKTLSEAALVNAQVYYANPERTKLLANVDRARSYWNISESDTVSAYPVCSQNPGSGDGNMAKTFADSIRSDISCVHSSKTIQSAQERCR